MWYCHVRITCPSHWYYHLARRTDVPDPGGAVMRKGATVPSSFMYASRLSNVCKKKVVVNKKIVNWRFSQYQSQQVSERSFQVWYWKDSIVHIPFSCQLKEWGEQTYLLVHHPAVLIFHRTMKEKKNNYKFWHIWDKMYNYTVAKRRIQVNQYYNYNNYKKLWKYDIENINNVHM